MSMTRRAFVTTAAAAATAGVTRAESFDGPLGFEIYSFRREMKRDGQATLAKIRQLGFHEVEVPEFYGLPPKDFRSALDDAGLKATSFLAQYDRLTGDFSGVVRDAHTLDASWVVFPWIPHKDAFTLDDVHRAAKEMNGWAKQLSAERL